MGETLSVGAGDMVVVPHQDAHTVKNGAPDEIIESQVPLKEALSGCPTSIRLGGAGAATRIVCGFLGFERDAAATFLTGLPRVFKVSLGNAARGRWMQASVMELLEEAHNQRPGSTLLLRNLAQALFVETLRQYMVAMPADQTGWLAAVRDPAVGRALGLLHRQPAHRWSVEQLAAQTGVSRTVLAERFTRVLGQPPLAYLARWRMTLAAHRLECTQESVLEVALSVGYTSESAFSRAFRRAFDAAPASYRRARKAERAGPALP